MKASKLEAGMVTATGAEVTRVEIERSGSESWVRYWTEREVGGERITYEFTCSGSDDVELADG